jgi:hypothetical protein
VLFPQFAVELEGEDVETWHQVVRLLTPRIATYLEAVPERTLKDFCDLVNAMVAAGGDQENAIATGLLEHASQVRVRKIIAPHLHDAARQELR